MALRSCIAGLSTQGTASTADDLPVQVRARASLNITNLTDKRYAANFDNSVFAPTDPAGSILVFHASAPQQIFGTISVDF